MFTSGLSNVEVPLPGDAMRITAMPNAVEGKGIWAASGVNAANVGMTATQDVHLQPPRSGCRPAGGVPARQGRSPEVPGGIGEEDIVYLVLPIIHSAREGVVVWRRLLVTGTYEMNGIAFQDVDEIWWLETVEAITGWPAVCRMIPTWSCRTSWASTLSTWTTLTAQKRIHLLCGPAGVPRGQSPRPVAGRKPEPARFCSHDDADHVYNTPRAW